jgi:hypothetical protein
LEGPLVLLGQQLRRRHQRGLKTALRRGDRRQEGHRRLAAPHVPLEKSRHRMRASQVGADLRPGARLGRRQPEGKSGLCSGDSRPRDVDGDPGLRSSLRPPQRQAHLEQVELLQHQSLVGRRLAGAKRIQVGIVTRIVDPAQGDGGLG